MLSMKTLGKNNARNPNGKRAGQQKKKTHRPDEKKRKGNPRCLERFWRQGIGKKTPRRKWRKSDAGHKWNQSQKRRWGRKRFKKGFHPANGKGN